MKLFRCVVEDNRDPLKLGRVRIRVLGVHNPKTKYVKTEELPWSESLGPIDAGNTLGSSTNILRGTWGWCLSLNDSFTEFLFLGTTKGIFKNLPTTDEDGDNIGFRDVLGKFPVRLNEPDNPLTYGKPLYPDITRDRVKVGDYVEPKDTSFESTYPDNKVYEDHNGNVLEVDGTPGNPRIRFQHSSGARIEINTKGDIILQSSKAGNIYQETPGLFALGADGNLIIECDVKVLGSVECTGELRDFEGNLSSLRAQHDANVEIQNQNVAAYNLHVHGTSPVPNNIQINEIKDPKIKFVWVGTPL